MNAPAAVLSEIQQVLIKAEKDAEKRIPQDGRDAWWNAMCARINFEIYVMRGEVTRVRYGAAA